MWEPCPFSFLWEVWSRAGPRKSVQPKARSPFQPVPPPPPPPNASLGDGSLGQHWVPPRPLGSPPRSRTQSPATPRRKPALARLGMSPATPGGTRVPSGTPPQTPPSVEHVVPCDNHGISSGGSAENPRDYIPGERTMWELPSEELRSERFVRLESRALAMLSKAVPASIFDYALSVRNTTCCGIVFFVLKAYQPGGLHERTELLTGLTVLGECSTAKQAVESLNVWTRHLERARSMGVSVPGCTLLLNALDTFLEKHPALLFRINSIRMTLQLDTVPSLAAVEQYAKSLTAELEVVAVSKEDSTASKKNKVAAIAGAREFLRKVRGKDRHLLRLHGARERGTPRSKVPCNGWITDSGCRFGKTCQFSHDADRPQKCWVCGGSHQKSECTAPGGAKGTSPESKAKAKAQALSTNLLQKLGWCIWEQPASQQSHRNCCLDSSSPHSCG